MEERRVSVGGEGQGRRAGTHMYAQNATWKAPKRKKMSVGAKAGVSKRE